jgi:hypothetical protein
MTHQPPAASPAAAASARVPHTHPPAFPAWHVLCAVALAVAALAAIPARAAAPVRATDPVVAEVLGMFQGGIAESVIVHWLEKSGKRPEHVESGDLLALHKAGASDGFLKKLVDLAGAAPPPPPPPPAAAEPGRPETQSPPAAPAPPAPPASTPAAEPAPRPAAAPPAPSAPPVPAPAPAPAPAAPPGGAVKVLLAVSYRPVLQEDELPWTLFVYVDGRFVASVEAIRLPVPLPARHFDVELAPGRHLLRVAEERHLKYSKVRGYLSPSRVDPDDFAFTLEAGKPAEVDIRFGDRSIRHAGPVEVSVKEDGREVAQSEPTRSNSETWPALCEDVAAALPAGARVSAAARRDQEHCLHWAELWPGLPGLAARAEVSAEIERHLHGGGGGAP